MATIQDRRNIDRTVAIFDNFYNVDISVDANKFDIVYSFFYERAKNSITAGNLTGTLFTISTLTNIDVITLLNDFGTANKLEINRQMIYYLNSIKSKAALYSVYKPLTPNIPVARNIIT